jgi:hypothetical protein
MKNNIGIFGEGRISCSDSDYTLLNPNVVGLELVISGSIKNENTVNFNISQNWRVDIKDEVPFKGNGHILVGKR